jgi:hypothetical protein
MLANSQHTNMAHCGAIDVQSLQVEGLKPWQAWFTHNDAKISKIKV